MATLHRLDHAGLGAPQPGLTAPHLGGGVGRDRHPRVGERDGPLASVVSALSEMGDGEVVQLRREDGRPDWVKRSSRSGRSAWSPA